MGKHVAPISQQPYMTAQAAGRLIADIMSEFRRDRREQANEVTDLAVETALAFGMAPPDSSLEEEEGFAMPYDDWAMLGLEVLATLSPTFADHLHTLLECESRHSDLHSREAVRPSQFE
jgi:hypothetical protein